MGISFIELQWQEFTAETVSANIDYIRAVAAVDPNFISHANVGSAAVALNDWGSLVKCVMSFGYAPAFKDAWQRLGIPKREGPPPSLELIEDRLRRVVGLLELGDMVPAWPAADKAGAKQELLGMQEAAATCRAELSSILREGQESHAHPTQVHGTGEAVQ